MSDKNKVAFWLTDIDTTIEVYELAKKEKITLQEAFEKVLKVRDDKIKLLAITDKKESTLTGDLRESGLKVFDLNEKARRNANKKTKNKI